MTDIPNTGAGNEPSLGGQNTGPVTTPAARVPLSIDIEKLRAPMKSFFKEMHELTQGFIKDMEKMGAAMGDVPTKARRGKQRGGGTPAQGTFEGQTTGAAAQVSQSRMGGGAGINTGGMFGGLRAFANRATSTTGLPIGPLTVGVGLLGGAAAQVVGAADQRIARGTEYASGADKLSVLTQQIYGLSQRQVMNDMRRPLTNYRLGAGGINQLLAFQASTGMAATPQLGRSIAGISAATGYAKGTGDILADQRALLQPDVANRMLFQLGTNAYTMGGKMRDPMQMRQQIVQNMGLNNSLVLRGASAPGSVTRARMTQAGIPQEMADDLIQYAKENQTFRQKGGRGNYDPSKPADRKRMGIEGNLATQQQETERLRTQREEQFMGRQIDNMTTAERQNQTMIKLLGSIEDTLSGALGARTSTAGWQKLLGRGLQIGGIGLAAATGGAGIPVGIGLSAIGTSMVGDPVPGDSNLPGGTVQASPALDSLKNRGDFKQLNPSMQDSLLRMFAANPRVGLGQGFRSGAQQESMFRSRYRKTDKKTNIQWQGSYWEHVSGAPAAPPGASMHEIGLAADLTGDLNWVQAHASEFGLKTFANVNNEPWHVQPVGLPNSRRQYEKGEGVASTPAAAGTSVPEVIGDSMGGSGGGGGPGSVSSYAGMSISQKLDASRMEGMGRLGGGGPMAKSKSTAKAAGTSAPGVTVSKGERLSGVDVARIAFAAGFRGDALIDFVGIAMRESGGQTGATNMTGPDNSYGLWQINMKGALGPDRVKRFGLKSAEDLYDPNVNARVAYEMSGGGANMSPWTIKGNPLARVDLSAAAKYVVDAGVKGDPMPMESRGSSTVQHISTGSSINFAPVINFYGVPQTPELSQIASEVGRQLKEQVRTLELRDA